jgi:hypothetical protein
MTVHICRDFLVNPITSERAGMYFTALFLHGVLGYTQVGHTNFDVNGTFKVASGTGGDMAVGNHGLEREVLVPSGQYVVTNADVDRIIALRSTAFPRHNSGLFRVTRVNTVNNSFYVDYRSASVPPVETGTLVWAVYTTEASITFNTGAGSSTYPSRGTATCSRVIFQTPSNAFHVRLCFEASTYSTELPNMTVSCGVGGNSSGDFQPGAEHNHPSMWFDRNSTIDTNFACGWNNIIVGSRFYAWGDTTSECVFAGVRATVSTAATAWVSFGMTDDEALPTPPHLAQRLFTMGNTGVDNANQWELNFGLRDTGDCDVGGTGYGLSLRPVSCCASGYTRLDIDMPNEGSAAYLLSTQSDSIITGRLELMTMDVVLGTHDAGIDTTQNHVHFTEVRRLGTWPMVRVGRNAIGNWTLTTDGTRSWFHTQNGMYLPWEGPNILP